MHSVLDPRAKSSKRAYNPCLTQATRATDSDTFDTSRVSNGSVNARAGDWAPSSGRPSTPPLAAVRGLTVSLEHDLLLSLVEKHLYNQ